MGALDDIAAERQRQMEVEGWIPDHDDTHTASELAHAAACYAVRGAEAEEHKGRKPGVPEAWPWHSHWWKPTTKRRDLVKAGALIVAEIERMDRAAAKGDTV